ncbi:HAD-IIB family hydrolase [Antarcticimicrobium luteum]|uniref:Mannosyl-3-phosphoglycerate phosphatase n=1 Tax=Antarcticimicrobium luteum TaxID=2547397 RepID=A0A4V3AS13_9RHOB|nr:HAD hydrolase family protein [Antarcticimicrobium luteum]TDK48717.1 mannosyl-3-phosphoglycerate phosphatase [Antarcticimicrobium luteum]
MTASRRPLIVFSDLDGTLLGHGDYSWAPAAPALRQLRRIGAGLVLASSKTAAEVAPLRAEIGFDDWPAIVENGCGLLPPGQADSDGTETYCKIRALLPDLPRGFRGFGDLSVEEVTEATGLPLAEAARAKTRQSSEPGIWTGTGQGLEEFLAAASALGLTARRGGRFLTLSMGGTKADRMDEILRAHGPRHSIALGDAPNDVEMLQRAEFGVIVSNDHAPPLPALPGEATGHILRTRQQGPQGWAEGISRLLLELDLIREPIADG